MQGRALDVTIRDNRTDDGKLNPPRSKPRGIFTVRMDIDFQFARIPRRKRRGMRALSRFKKQVYCFSEFVSQWKEA